MRRSGICARAEMPPGQKPSRLGRALAFSLLVGLLFWRIALPNASPWLDIGALAVVGVFLLAVKSFVRDREDRSRD